MTAKHAEAALLRDTARVAAALLLLTAMVAVIVHCGLAEQARGLLQFSFPTQRPSISRAAVIFTHNLRALAAIAAVAVIACAPHVAGRAAGSVQQLLRLGAELVLSAGVAGNLVVIGAAFGGYGGRMLLAALPQGPFELAAYALALAGYLHQRRSPTSTRRALITAACSVALLAVAAVLEAYVAP